MIGHALTVAPAPAEREAWDRWIATGCAVGSGCFFIGAPLVLPRRSMEDTRSAGRRIATKEV